MSANELGDIIAKKTREIEDAGLCQFSIATTDDLAVIEFAELMKQKLRYSALVKGRHGWETMDEESLWWHLEEHMRKGDPVDVANYAMMIHHNRKRLKEKKVEVNNSSSGT